MSNFKISTTAFNNGDILPMEQVLNAHGCTGGNISPDLKWENAPDNTKEFALIVHDPDAPVLNGWYHWIVLNIPNYVLSFEKGIKITNPMVEAPTSFTDVNGYGGACPPIGHGIHHYHFTIYALDVEKLDIKKDTKPTEVEKLVQEHTLAKSTITGLFERK